MEEKNIGKNTTYEYGVAKELLDCIDYDRAVRNGEAHVSREMMMESLSKLPIHILESWLVSFIFIKNNLMSAGYEFNSFKIYKDFTHKIDEVEKEDKEFNIKEYIFSL